VLKRFGRAHAGAAEATGQWQPELLSVEQGQLLAEMVETVIPETDSPGAKAAGVHIFIDLLLEHCRSAPEQDAFVKGLAAVDSRCRGFHTVGFVEASPVSREELLRRLDADADPFVRTLKQLTALGYCTSQVGATQALAHVTVPGEYEACVDLKPGQKSWATR
jgi:hypothetical protein